MSVARMYVHVPALLEHSADHLGELSIMVATTVVPPLRDPSSERPPLIKNQKLHARNDSTYKQPCGQRTTNYVELKTITDLNKSSVEHIPHVHIAQCVEIYSGEHGILPQ